MGIINCPKHGRSGFLEMCQHVDAEFKSGNYREFRSLHFWGDLLVCDNCWDENNFAHFENHPEFEDKELWDIEEETPIFQEYNKVYSELPRRAWSCKCLAELRDKNQSVV